MRVAILGAGICGLYLAKNLSKEHEVFVFEKNQNVGEKVCSCLLSERAFQFFPDAEKLVKNKIEGCKIYFPQKTVFLKFKRPFFCFERKELDEFAFESVKKAKFIFGKEIKEKDFYELEKEFDLIVGADGALSVTRRYLKGPSPEIYFARQVFEEKTDTSSFIETWPTKNGFFWRIPKGGFVEWGVLGKKEDLEEFENFLKEKRIQILNKKSAFVANGFWLPNHPKITLCGEAAGLTKPWSGGGIVWGLTLANILIKYFPHFQKYAKEAKKIFSLEIFFSKILKKAVYFFGFWFPFLLPQKALIDGDFFVKERI